MKRDLLGCIFGILLLRIYVEVDDEISQISLKSAGVLKRGDDTLRIGRPNSSSFVASMPVLPPRERWSCSAQIISRNKHRYAEFRHHIAQELCRFLCDYREESTAYMTDSPSTAPILVLNLPRRADRRAFMRKKSQRFSEMIEFVDAVDCRDSPFCHGIYFKMLSSYRQRGLSDEQSWPRVGAVGILCSVANLFDQVLDSGAQEVILLDDDVYFTDSFFARLDELRRQNSSKLVIYLGAHMLRPSSSIKREMENALSGHGFYHTSTGNGFGSEIFSQFAYGTYGLLLRRPLIQLLKKALRPKLPS